MSPGPSRRQFLRTAGRGAVALALVPRLVLRETARSAPAAVRIERACITMGSMLHVTAHGEDRAVVIQAMSAAFAEVDRLDRLLSVYRPESAISRINRAAGRGPVEVPGDVLEIVSRAQLLSTHLQERFDITIEPLMRAWGFRESALRAIPSDRTLQTLLAATGPHQILVDGRSGTVGLRHAGGAIDLGGIGVGVALDRAAAILRRHGVTSAFLNHSGDALAMGVDGEEAWRVGIPDPLNPEDICLSFDLVDRAVSTSGSYENNRRLGNSTFGHLLNPRTGMPVDDHLSVTVIASTSTAADVLSTALACGARPDEVSAVDASVQALILDAASDGLAATWHPGPPPGRHGAGR